MPRRRLVATLLGTATFAVISATGAFAADGMVTTTGLGAQLAPAPACTQDGVRVDYELAGQQVRAVTLGGLPETCDGKNLSVSLGLRRGSIVTTGVVTGTSTTLALASPVDVADVTTVAVVVSG